MSDDQVPIEYELLHTATLADITIMSTDIQPTTDEDSWVRIEAKVGNEEEDENDVEWSAFGLIYALGVLSFSDARPRGMSGIEFEKKECAPFTQINTLSGWRKGPTGFNVYNLQGFEPFDRQ